MKSTKIDPKETMKSLEERLKELPGMSDLIDKIGKFDTPSTANGDDAGDNGHFKLPYSSDPPPIEEPWN